MNTRDRFHGIAHGKDVDRLPILEWAGWWDQTLERWHGEGLPSSIQDRYDICRHFNLDLYAQNWVQPRKSSCPKAPKHGVGIIDDEKGYELVREHLYPDPITNESFDLFFKKWVPLQEKGEAVIWFTVDGFFWFARTLLGIEDHLYAFYDQPELLHRINTDLVNWIKMVYSRILEHCEPDFMTFAEDMSYNKGPMLSEDLYDEFMHPYYREVVPLLEKHHTLPIIDSDGDISTPVHWFKRSGLKGVLPLERQAGVDIDALQSDHPEMVFIGHYDKMVMNQGENAIRREFDRLIPAAKKGRFFISCDHQTPPGVSYDQYLTYLKVFKEVGVM